MPKNFTAHRIKAATNAAVTNAVRFRCAESPNAVAAPSPDSGTDGIFKVVPQYNSDGAGTYVGLFEIDIQPIISDDGNVNPMSCLVTITPIKGDGTSDTANAKSFTLAHSQTLDAWLTAAGIART